jgi:PAS domain S-box-containing protein
MANLTFKHKIQKSLRHKLLLPMILVGLALTAGVITFAYFRFEELLVEKLAIRAELLANTVNYAAEGLSRAGEMQRIVSALGAEKEVNLILVVAGTQPARIVASNKIAFLGKTLDCLSDNEIKAHIQGSLNSQLKVSYFDEDSRNYEIATPLLMSQIKTINQTALINAVVFVQLDSIQTERDAKKTIAQFAALFLGVFLILIYYSYGLLRYYVVKPITQIIHQISDGQKIELKKHDEKNYDEISLLGNTLSQVFEELRQSEQRLCEIIDLLPVPLAMNDNVPNLIFLNHTFTETFGYDLNDIPTLKIWWEAAYPDENYRQWVINSWNKSVEKMHVGNAPFVPLEVIVRCKNGNLKNVLASAVQISENVNLVALYDITEHKKIELDLARSNADLEQFAYAVSHDMRQPLRMVTSYLKLVEAAIKNQLDDETREFLQFAVDGAKRMDSMILSLLDYSRMGRATHLFEQISSQNALEEALQFLQPELETSGGSVEISGDWVEILANQDELTRLLQNLIGNALKYHTENEPPQVHVLAITTQNKFRVEVKDVGIGIEPSQINRLFKVFSRLQSSSKFEGTGVGLALCRKIVEHHGGEIGVFSKGKSEGCTFWFEIPIDSEMVAQF